METEFAVSLGSQRWTLPADSDTFTIGRGSNADIRLPSDDQISRIHARLNRTGTTWTLVDESRNGTALNGRRLAAPTALTDNDRIQIGRSALTFHASPATTPPAPAPDQNRPPVPPPGTPAPTSGRPDGPPAAPRPEGQPSGPANAAAASAAALAAGSASAAGLAAAGKSSAPPPAPASPPSRPGGAPAPGGSPAQRDTPPQRDPGGMPAQAGPGSAPAQAGPGGTPAQAGPGSAPAQAGPGGGPSARAAGAPVGDPREPAQAGPAGGPSAPAAGGPTGGPGTTPRAPADGPGTTTPGMRADGPGDSPFRESGSEAYAAEAPVDQPFWGEANAPAGGGSGADRSEEFADDFYDQIIGAEPEGGEWVGGARVGSVEVEDGGASWAAYPSANNPEPARSPWSTSKRPALTQPEGGQANWAESAGWPDSAFEQQEQTPPPARQPEPVRRKQPPTEPAPPGYVRLVRVLLVAAAVLGLGLIINVVATFFADGAGGPLRWLVPPAIALIAAMAVALIDAVSSEDRPAGGRLDVPVIIAIVAVLIGVGIGGFALTAGAEYVAGYITGKESGEDRLLKPVAKTTAGLTVTVENVTYTSHFTRVEVSVSNGGDQSLSLPLEGQAAFTGADGHSLKADGFRSQWQDSISPGSVERGTITFEGHLPQGLDVAILTLKPGDAPIAVPGIALSK